jgi:hypothetical protein
MSFETLLLLVIFILAPLVEFFRAARKRGQRRPPSDSAEWQPEVASEPPFDAQTPVQEPVREVQAVPFLSAPAERRFPTVTRQLRPKRQPAVSVGRDRATHRQTRPRGTVVGLRSSLDLRRAIVLTTILGPCRANNSYEWPERTKRE